MKRSTFWKSAVLIAALVLLCVPSVMAQKSDGDTPAKPVSKAVYDLATEVKLKGTVEEVKLVPGANEGVHVMLKTSGETVLVHIAPPEFLKEFEFPVNKGDQYQLVGSKLKIDGQDEVLAREITKGENSVILRDSKGAPIWTLWPKK